MRSIALSIHSSWKQLPDEIATAVAAAAVWVIWATAAFLFIRHQAVAEEQLRESHQELATTLAVVCSASMVAGLIGTLVFEARTQS